MKYEIIEIDGLFCIFRAERLGSRIVCACETLKEAKARVARYRSK